jgi:hypothetical protein
VNLRGALGESAFAVSLRLGTLFRPLRLKRRSRLSRATAGAAQLSVEADKRRRSPYGLPLALAA